MAERFGTAGYAATASEAMNLGNQLIDLGIAADDAYSRSGDWCQLESIE